MCHRVSSQRVMVDWFKVNVNESLLQAWTGPEVSRSLRLPDFKVVVLHTGYLYPPGITPGTHFCQRLDRPQGHSVIGRIMSMENFNYTIGNRTRDLPACSAMRQPTAPQRVLATCNGRLIYPYLANVENMLSPY